MKPKKPTLLFALLAAGLVSSALVKGIPALNPLPGDRLDRWHHPTEIGFEEATLADLSALLETLGTTGLIVLVGGKVLFEYGDITARGYLGEARTAILALLFGTPVSEGSINLGQTIGSLGIDDRAGLLALEKTATVGDLLSGRSGVYHPSVFLWDSPDHPPRGSVTPGTRFSLHSWGSLAACGVFELLTGRGFYQALHEDLGGPIGFQDFRWKRHKKDGDPTRSGFPKYEVYLSTRDVARIGQLMLQDGQWEGQQVLPVGWVDRVTRIRTPRRQLHPESLREGLVGFGYYWWTWEDPATDGPFAGAFTYRGAYGQYLTVLPKMEMVVAHQVFAGWYGPPEKPVSWKEYEGLLERLVSAGGNGG